MRDCIKQTCRAAGEETTEDAFHEEHRSTAEFAPSKPQKSAKDATDRLHTPFFGSVSLQGCIAPSI